MPHGGATVYAVKLMGSMGRPLAKKGAMIVDLTIV